MVPVAVPPLRFSLWGAAICVSLSVMANAFTSAGLFGTLFADPEIAAEFAPSAFVGRIIAFERAWTEGLAAAGSIKPAVADAVLAHLARPEVADIAGLGHAAERDGMCLPELVSRLRGDLPDFAREGLHAGATSQDAIDTAMVLTLRAVLARFETRLIALDAALDALEARLGDAPLMGRTRMQAALPIGARARILAWAQPLRGHRAALDGVRARLLRLQLGGAVGLRNRPSEALAETAARHAATALGLELGPVWHSDRSAMVAAGGWMQLLAGSLGKIGQDIALMAQMGEIVLSGGGTSSAMAHKRNPVTAEILVALARQVSHAQGLMGQAMIHEQERSGAAWALEWIALPDMAEATGTALRHAASLIGATERIGGPAL